MRLGWIGNFIGIVTGAIAIAKLIMLLGDVGVAGVPALIIGAYTDFVDQVQKYLIEIPFHFTPPPWAKHAAVVYAVFAGSNLRFLTRNNHGEKLLTGIGDFGRGTRRGSLSTLELHVWFAVLALSGPIFTILVGLMWLGNIRPGPSGQGRLGDWLMIGNRSYTVRIAGLYLLILLVQPVIGAALLLWGLVS